MFMKFNATIRRVKRNKNLSAINILGLSIGLAFCFLILLYVNDELNFDRFHRQRRDIYRILVNMKTPQGTDRAPFTQVVLREALRAGIPEIRSSARNFMGTHLVRAGEKSFLEGIMYTDPEFFEIFSFPLKYGEPRNLLKSKRSIVISRRMARKLFGREEAIGETVGLQFKDGFLDFAVGGVMENVPLNSSIRFECAIPFDNLEDLWGAENMLTWGDFSVATYLLLHPRSDWTGVERKVNEIAGGNTAKIFGEQFKPSLALEPFSKVHLDSKLSFASANGIQNVSNPLYSYILSGLAYFILFIACINYTNLSIAQAIPRSREIGIRKCVGASPWQLTTQFLSESFLSTAFAFVLAVVLAELFLPFFNRVAEKSISISWRLGIRFFLACLLLVTVTTLMAGGFPAVFMSRLDPIRALGKRILFNTKSLFPRILLVIQFAISLFLMAGAMTIRQQLNFVSRSPLGYDDRNLVLVPAYGEDCGKLAPLFRNELALYGFSVTADSRYGNRSVVNYRKENQFDMDHCKIGDDYIRTMRLQLAAGRTLSSEYPSDPQNSVLVNETFVKRAGLADPVGEKISCACGTISNPTIVGVVRDFHYKSLREAIGPLVLHMDPVFGLSTLVIRVPPGRNASESVSLIERTWKKLVPYAPFNYQFYSVQNREQYRAEEHWRAIVTCSAIFALFISLMGLLGISTLNLKSRTKEIGIRKTLGSSLPALLGLFTRDVIALILVSMAVGFPASVYFLNQWLHNFAYRVRMDVWTFLFSAVLAVGITLMVLAYQVVKAATANPVEALRYE
jgi:putative ABC transport system permease protein